MTERTVCLSPLRVSPGMVLARHVLRADGEVLLAAGTKLDSEKMQHLMQRHVEFVHVLVDDPRDAAAIEQEVAQVASRVNHIFRGQSGEARDELRAAVAAYRLAGLS